MTDSRGLRNGLYRRLLDMAEAPLTRRLVQGLGRRVALWRRWRARR